MRGPDEFPTLASLRRSGGGVRRRPTTQAPGLFDDPLPDTPAAPLPVSEVNPVQPFPQPATATDEPFLPTSTPFPNFPASPQAAPLEDPSPPPARVWSVSGLVRHVRGIVERDVDRVTVEGEISNWRPAASGHCYFTVKDNNAQLSAVLFRRQAALLRFQPRDGDAVKLYGQLSVFEGRGQMQLVVEWMQQAGLGALLAELQRLKEKLRREGLFNQKRPLPPFPRCIGIITSLHGAALRDIIKVCRRRHAAVRLLIFPAAVQGPSCPGEIAAGLRWFNAHSGEAEVVLIARGGGSWEDLHGFDDEQVVRALASSVLPTITGIGHATDTTLADAAADLCAPTPSAAAELLTAAQHRVEDDLARFTERLRRAGRFELLRARERFVGFSAANLAKPLQNTLNRHTQQLDELWFRTQSILNAGLRARNNRLRLAEARLARLSPASRLERDRRRLEHLNHRLEHLTRDRLVQLRHHAQSTQARLETLSPLRVLDRGYALVYGPEGRLLRSAAEVEPPQRIQLRLARGRVEAQVTASVPAQPDLLHPGPSQPGS